MWAQWHTDQGKQPQALRSDGHFYVLNDELYDEFDEFRMSHPHDFVYETYLEDKELLGYWIEKEKIPNRKIQKYGKNYVILSQPYVDKLCEWVVSMRKKYGDKGQHIFDQYPCIHCIMFWYRLNFLVYQITSAYVTFSLPVVQRTLTISCCHFTTIYATNSCLDQDGY